jgi:hypothetical protein
VTILSCGYVECNAIWFTIDCLCVLFMGGGVKGGVNASSHLKEILVKADGF